jgi:hypothetical protein
MANQQDDWEDDFKVDGSVRLLLEARLVRESFCRPLAGTGLTAGYNSHRRQAVAIDFLTPVSRRDIKAKALAS